MIPRARALLIAAVVTLAFMGGACSSRSGDAPATRAPVAPPDAADYAGRGPYGVGVTTLDLVDASRPTAPNREAPGTPDRRFAVEVWYPAAPDVASPEARDAMIERGDAPYPLIIFAHGFSAFRRQSASFMQHLASRGYVVASPDFPQSRLDTPGGPRISAVLDQPADVSFVIDELLRLDAAPDGQLAGAIDETKVGMSGHSLGGLTTLLTAYGAARDDRIRAIAPISPVGCLVPANLGADASLPAMIIGGTREKIVDPSSIRRGYDAASRPKYFVQIIGADHVRFADINTTDDQLGNIVQTTSRGDVAGDAIKVAQADGADVASCLTKTAETDELITGDRQRELLRTVATPFFDAYLKDDAVAKRFLAEALSSVEGIRLESTVSE